MDWLRERIKRLDKRDRQRARRRAQRRQRRLAQDKREWNNTVELIKKECGASD